MWKWYVRVECVAEALDQGDRPGVGRLPGKIRPSDHVRGDAAIDNAEHLAQDGAAAGEQKPQRIRDTQDPLPHRLFGEHLIHQQRRAFHHAPGTALSRPWVRPTSQWHEAGVPLDLMHRVTSVATGGLDSLPHNGAVIILLAITGLGHRDAYKDIFVVAVVAPIIALIVLITLGTLFGSF
jgi:hypothetical protein